MSKYSLSLSLVPKSKRESFAKSVAIAKISFGRDCSVFIKDGCLIVERKNNKMHLIRTVNKIVSQILDISNMPIFMTIPRNVSKYQRFSQLPIGFPMEKVEDYYLEALDVPYGTLSDPNKVRELSAMLEAVGVRPHEGMFNSIYKDMCLKKVVQKHLNPKHITPPVMIVSLNLKAILANLWPFHGIAECEGECLPDMHCQMRALDEYNCVTMLENKYFNKWNDVYVNDDIYNSFKTQWPSTVMSLATCPSNVKPHDRMIMVKTGSWQRKLVLFTYAGPTPVGLDNEILKRLLLAVTQVDLNRVEAHMSVLLMEMIALTTVSSSEHIKTGFRGMCTDAKMLTNEFDFWEWYCNCAVFYDMMRYDACPRLQAYVGSDLPMRVLMMGKFMSELESFVFSMIGSDWVRALVPMFVRLRLPWKEIDGEEQKWNTMLHAMGYSLPKMPKIQKSTQYGLSYLNAKDVHQQYHPRAVTLAIRNYITYETCCPETSMIKFFKGQKIPFSIVDRHVFSNYVIVFDNEKLMDDWEYTMESRIKEIIKQPGSINTCWYVSEDMGTIIPKPISNEEVLRLFRGSSEKRKNQNKRDNFTI